VFVDQVKCELERKATHREVAINLSDVQSENSKPQDLTLKVVALMSVQSEKCVF
jgi:hypothetical protein